jgi:8-oxo-dGTP pyrophosphatase MutT (NUDIX family)
MSQSPEPDSQSPVQQATAVPYQWREGSLEFCLITSTEQRHWAFPKGMVDPGETGAETALKEAREEAGLEGSIDGEPLGQYRYSKWGLDLEVTVLLMRVTHMADEWLESHVRERRWATADEARQLIARPELRSMLDTAIARLRKPS